MTVSYMQEYRYHLLFLTENYPPRFVTQLSQVNVTVNQSISVTVVAEDPNNDTLIFSVFGVLPRTAILRNNSNSVTVMWNGTNEQVFFQ